MREDFFELGSRFGRASGGEKRLASDVNRVEIPEEEIKGKG